MCRSDSGGGEKAERGSGRYCDATANNNNIQIEEMKKLTEQNEKLKKEKAELDAKLLAMEKEQERLKYLYGYLLQYILLGQSFIKIAASLKTLSIQSFSINGWRRQLKPRSNSNYYGKAPATVSQHPPSTLNAMEKDRQ